MALSTTPRPKRLAALDADDAFIALLIATMDASEHVSPLPQTIGGRPAPKARSLSSGP
jgi:hypothetical protein